MGRHGQLGRGGGRTVLSLVERDEGTTRQAAATDIDVDGPLTLGEPRRGSGTSATGCARPWDRVGPRRALRRRPVPAGVHRGDVQVRHPAANLVDAVCTADVTDVRLSCW
ncbi:hypothetical protein [Streptomyces sp. ALI-76-A]|uniref:hypothetical protein n=1 Tax=Streptomyces sp. ALI-76-A TaxID=3025736 RepID=UPI00256EE261|nr:hypothetical protein [Streptomyces sp. ALI-76-A]MDL5204498.1 hypothetical protein [Streptomyces sp. ALI-76-A]